MDHRKWGHSSGCCSWLQQGGRLQEAARWHTTSLSRVLPPYISPLMRHICVLDVISLVLLYRFEINFSCCTQGEILRGGRPIDVFLSGQFQTFCHIHLKIFCYKCEQHLNIPISEDKVDSGLSGRGAKCSVKARWESKTGCCYLTFPSCNAT